MKRRQEAADEAERQRVQAEADAKAAAEAAAEAARQAEASNRDSSDAPGSPHSSREHEAGKHTISLPSSIHPLAHLVYIIGLRTLPPHVLPSVYFNKFLTINSISHTLRSELR